MGEYFDSGEAVGESFPSLAGVFCVLEAWFIVCKVFAIGHGITMDSLRGVFLLAAVFALRMIVLVHLSDYWVDTMNGGCLSRKDGARAYIFFSYTAGDSGCQGERRCAVQSDVLSREIYCSKN